MLTEFENKVAGFIKDNIPFSPVAKVLLAVSGGADSMALLYAMCALKAEGVFNTELICAHINHQLRGSDSDGDEDFVIAQANKLNLSLTTRRLDVRGFASKNKLSIETAARKLRIESLLDITKANNCNWIATGHQKNDNAETLLQRLRRGTGFRGLGGIWPVRNFADSISFVRPLLCVRRDEIIEYLKKRSLRWRVDHTNYDCTYRRNYIRHRLIPALQADCRGSIVEQLFDLSQSARKFHSLICSSVEKVWPELADCTGEKIVLDLKMFLTQPTAVKVELVRRSLARSGSGERNLTQGHFKRILQLAERNINGKRIELPDRFVVWREYGNLIFARLQESCQPQEQTKKSVELEIPGRTRFGRYLIEAAILAAEEGDVKKFKAGKSNFVEWLDLDKVKPPLVVRLRQTGDRFWPLGLGGEKKVGKFLTAAKVPQEVRRKLLIVADSEKIIWAWPIRISEQAKVTLVSAERQPVAGSGTRKILQLRITDTKLAD